MGNRYFVLTDNTGLYTRLKMLFTKKHIVDLFDFYCSPENSDMQKLGLISLNMFEQQEFLLSNYKMGFSIHSKQLFPKKVVQGMHCINIHPGFNPYNRGWYPQVFSIINDEIVGATIHFMDEKIDNGDIIDRMEVKKELWDTSESLYKRILDCEVILLEKNIDKILSGKAIGFPPEFQGKLYLKKDFEDLCEIELNRTGNFLEFYNLLRALSFERYDNAFIRDSSTGKKVFIRLNINHE